MTKPGTKGTGRSWIVLGILCLVGTLLLATLGICEVYRAAKQPLNPLDFGYCLLQVFKGGLQLPFASDPFNNEPLSLKIARFVAPFLLLLISGKVLYNLLSHEWTAFRCRWLHQHVMVCGAGHKGRLLANQFLEQRRKVVVLESDPQNDVLLELKTKGARILLCNAADAARLQRANAAWASHVFAVTNKDETNLEIALEVNALRRQGLTSPPFLDRVRLAVRHLIHGRNPAQERLLIFAHVQSPQLRELFKRQAPFATLSQDQQQEARLFDCEATAARALVAREIESFACHGKEEPAPRFLLCGEGHFIEELLRQIIINAHFGNNQKPNITLLSTDPKLPLLFNQRFDLVHLVADVHFIEILDHRLGAQAFDRLPKGVTYDFAAISLRSDVDALQWSQSLARLAQYKRDKAGSAEPPFRLKSLYACLLPTSSLPALELAEPSRATVVSLAKEGCNLGVLLDAELDKEAIRLHEKYLEAQFQKPVEQRSIKAIPWEALDEFTREDNRSAALHNRIKRFARQVVSSGAWNSAENPETINDQDLGKVIKEKLVQGPGHLHLRERLAEAEHNRWMANRIMNDWRPGPRDDEAKIHHDIVPYDQLPEGTKKYDRLNVDEAWRTTH